MEPTTAITKVRAAAPVALRPDTIESYWQIAQYMASSSLVPRDYQSKPENCLIAMQMGAELGLAPMQSIQSIAVINGRPALWGDGLLALLQQSSAFDHAAFSETWTGSAGDLEAQCTMSRRDGSPQTRTFSVKDAAQAGLWGKSGPWKQYPKRMLQMRARAWCARDLFSDVLRGFSVAEEYIGVEDAVVTIETNDAPPPASRTEAVKQAISVVNVGNESAAVVSPQEPTPEPAPAPTPAPDPAPQAEPETLFDEPASDSVTQTQMRALHAIGKSKGHDHDTISRFAQEAFDVESLTALTSQQASQLISSLQG